MPDKRSIYSKNCWVEGMLQSATIIFEDGIITSIVNGKPGNAEDVSPLIVMPGIIDAHVHINEPGRTDWEGFNTATMAAAAGGITTVIDMPLNASPVTTSVAAFNEKLMATGNKLHVNCGFYGGLVPGNLDELEPMIKAGVSGIKCFLIHSGIDDFPNVTENDIDLAMPVLAKHNIPLLVHCEIQPEISELSMKDCGSYNEYLQSRPVEWECNAIKMLVRLCRKHGCRTHIVHVSSAEALEIIHSAKNEGLPLTAETCPHYIYFNAETIPDNNTLFKCAPPIRNQQNNLLLKESLRSGLLDFITTDHSPAPPELKETVSCNLQKAWGGIAGLQFLLSASWTSLMNMIPIERFITLLTEHPAKFLGLKNKGTFDIGADADIVIWDPQAVFTVNENDVLHRHKISPYIGELLTGKVIETIVGGYTVYKKGSIIQKSKGKVLLNIE